MTESCYRVRLSFWGTGVEYLLPTNEDAEHVAHYFAEHRYDGSGTRHSFLFRTSRGGFINGLTDSAVDKEIWHSTDCKDWVLWDHFAERSMRETPLPPLTLPPLSTDFGFFHAAALATPSGHGGLFVGPSFSGKSTLSLKLAYSGWGLLTDDLSVVNIENRTIHAFRRPIGVRENTFTLVPEIEDSIVKNSKSTKIEFGKVSTHMMHAATLGISVLPDKTPLRFLVRLCNEPEYDRAALNKCTEKDVTEVMQANFNGGTFPAWMKELPFWTLNYNLETQLNQAVKSLTQTLEASDF